MGKGLGDKLVVAISSRALFDLDESHRIYESEGVEAYRQYQIAHEDEVLQPGDAFALVQKLLGLNEMLGRQLVEVVLVSRNSADTGLRVFNSIQQHGLGISRAAFVGGRSPYPYLAAFGCHLFLSTHVEDVLSALENGFAAATILSAGPAARPPANCASPSTATPCCSPTRPSGCSSRAAWRPSRRASRLPPASRWAAARSSPSWRR